MNFFRSIFKAIVFKRYLFIFFFVFLSFFVFSVLKGNSLPDFEYTIEYPKNIDIDNQNLLKISTFIFKDKDIKDIANIDISLFYKDNIIYKTKTNSKGLALININKDLFKNLKSKNDFNINDQKNLELIAKIGNNQERLSFNIIKNYKAIITLDKPIYQPGQKVFIKIITLKQINNIFKPISDNFILEILDPKGNKLEYKKIKTDKWGTLFFEYNLSSLINLGTYKINLKKDNDVISTVNFEVDRYTLPKFKIELKTNQNYLVINRNYQMELDLSYFFGKKVEAYINIDVFSFDAQFYKLYSINGKTDKNGKYIFNLKVPNYLTGIDKDKGLLKLTITAKDKANQIETKDFIFNVYSNDIISDIVPENEIILNVENNFLCVFYYPESAKIDNNFKVIFNKPFKKTFEVKGNTLSFTYKPDKNEIYFDYEIIDLNRNLKSNFTKRLYINDNVDDFIFLNLDKVLYKVGDKANLEIILNNLRDVYLELNLKTDSGYITLFTDTIKVNKKANYSFNLNYSGNLFIRAYYINERGFFVDNIKSIIVEKNDNFKIITKTNKNIYKPKDNLELTINTVLGNKQVDSKVLIDIVDEAVLYLANKTPELLKLYLSLVQELLTPKYEAHNYIDFIINEQNNLLKYAFLKDYNNSLKQEFDNNVFRVFSLSKKYELTLNNAIKTYEKVSNYYYRFKVVPYDLLKTFGNLDYLYDGWKNLFKVELKDNSIKIISAGFDKKFNTSDDLVYPDDYYKFYKYNKRIIFEKSFVRALEIGAPQFKSTENLKKIDTNNNQDLSYLRQYFPETFYSNIIDSNKTLSLKLPDSITNWKVSLLAIDNNGNIADKILDIKTFQEFFIDVNLPLFLTKNDEISIPVIIYNYTDKKLNVNLVINKEDWFELLDSNQKNIVIESKGIDKVYFRIKAVKVGKNNLTILAYSKDTNLKDAIKKEIEVVPYGQYVQNVSSFSGNSNIDFVVNGEGKGAYLVVYPALFSQVLNGLDKLLAMPYGCFEQTSSVNYPNVLILKYLKQKGISKPDIIMKANYYITIGYQRLLTFEVEGGGFSWFGDKPANKVLTAFGLKEFKDMKDVVFVDEDLIRRTKEFLLNQQLGDGSWEPDKTFLHQEVWQNIQKSKITTTAYILDALLENDPSILKNSKIDNSVKFIIDNIKDIKQIDNYTLSFIFNSLINYVINSNLMGFETKNYHKAIEKIIIIKEELINRAKNKDDTIFFEGINQGTFFYGDLNTSSIETTANIALAFIKLSKININQLKDSSYMNYAYKMIKFLINSKSDNGLWYSTQPTIMALKAIFYFELYSASYNQPKNAIININDKSINISFTKDELAYKIIDLTTYLRDGKNYLKTNGDSLYYDLVYYQYLPFDKVSNNLKELDIIVNYDRTNIKENDIIVVNVSIKKLIKGALEMVVLDLGIPPGFSVITDKLDQLKQKGVIKNYELTYNQIIIYFDKIDSDINFSYEIRANYPLKVRIPSSKIYEYYKPSNKLEKSGGILVAN